MAETEKIPTVPESAQVPKKKPGKFWRYVRRTLLVLLLLLLLLLGSTQTPPFRNFLRSQLVSLVADATNADISLGTIGGNLITGITIDDIIVRLKNDNRPIASIKRIAVRYSLWDLLFSKGIAIAEVRLDSPIIRLERTKGDSVWNIAKLFKPTPKDSASKPFDQTISLSHLGINNGSFSAYDANDSSAKTIELPYGNPLHKKTLVYSNVNFEHFSLSMSGKVQGADIQYAKINELSFREMNSNFAINHLSLIASRNKSNIEVKSLHLITDLSNIKIDATVFPLVMLDSGKTYYDLGTSQTHIAIHAPAVSQLELSQCVPNLAALSGSPSLDIEFDGPYNDLKIKQARLQFINNGVISFAGTVKNLNDPEKIYFDLSLIGKALSDNIVRTYLPGIAVPDLRGYGRIDIPKLLYKGTVNNFASDFIVHSGAGSVDGSAKLDLSKKTATYATKLQTQNLNLAPILLDSSFKSNLNLSVDATGSGFDYHSMNTSFVIEGKETSSISTVSANAVTLRGSMKEGKASLEKSHIGFNDGSRFDAEYAIIDLNDPNLPYECDATAMDIPIAKFLPAFPKSASANVDATIAGEIKSFGKIAGSLHAVVSGLTYHRDTLAPILVAATLGYNDSTHDRSDVISSDIADISVKGKYDVATLGMVLGDRLNAFAHAFDKLPDDSLLALNDSVPKFRTISCADSLHTDFTMNLKDLRPLDHFMPGMTLLARGKVDGSIIGCPLEAMDVRLDGKLEHLLVKPYSDQDQTPMPVPEIVSKDLMFRIGLRNLVTNTNEVLAKARGGVRISTDSMLYVSGIGITHPFAAIRLDRDSIRYTIAGNVQDKSSIRVKGNASVIGAKKSFVLDSVQVVFSDGFEWNNEAPAVVSISEQDGLLVDSLTLIRPEASFDPGNMLAQRITLGANIANDSIRYAFVHTRLLRVAELPKFVASWVDVSNLGRMEGRLPVFNVDMNGTMSHPVVNTDLAINNITYSSVTIDTGRIALNYKDGTLKGQALLHVDSEAFWIESVKAGLAKIVPSRANKLDIEIDSVPVLFSLADYPERKADSIRNAKKPLSLRVETNDFPLDVFSPVIPIIANFHGLGNVKFAVKGSLEKIDYGGEVNIIQGSFLLPATNVNYNIEGPIKLSQDALIFDHLKLQNVAADDPNGKANIDGSLYFKGFVIDSMRFTLATERLLVLNDASKESLKTLYGHLSIETGAQPLTFYGSLDEPHLDGDIKILQAEITLPQTLSSAAQLQNDGITYVIASNTYIDTDTTEIIKDTIVVKPPERDLEEEAFYAEISPSVPTVKPELDSTMVGPTIVQENTAFVDKMLYDLRITVPGDFWLNIAFNRAYGLTGEQLKAEIKTDGVLTFSRDRPYAEYAVTGTLQLMEHSSYTFLKEFSPVTGTLQFQGSLDNPVLDLSAEYIGAHESDEFGDVKIRLTIRGTKNDPRITFELFKKNKTTNEFVRDGRSPDQIQKDAIYFLATGSLPSEGGVGNAVNIPTSAGVSILAGIANEAISSTALKEYIKNVGLEYGTATPYKLKLSGGFEDISFKYGGTFGNNATSSQNSQDFSVELPLSQFFKFSGARNFLLQGEGHFVSDETDIRLRNQPKYMGIFSYRFSFP